MENEEVETQTGTFRLGEDGIIRGVIVSSEEHNLTHAKENSEAVQKVSNGNKSPLFIDISRCKSITREARTHYAREQVGEEVNAIALLIDSPVSRVIGNLFIGFNKPKHPLKLFNSETNAIKWLLDFMNDA